VVLYRPTVVCLCCLDFVPEAAEVYLLFLELYLCNPFSNVLSPVNSFVFRLCCTRTFFSVAHVLRMRRRSQVVASIVQTVVVDMVGHLPVGNFHNLLVHVYQLSFSPFVYCHPPECVKAVSPFLCKPFVSSQPFVVFGVDLCVFRLRKADQPERIPIAGPAVEKQEPDGQMHQLSCDYNEDVIDNNHPPSGEISLKF
jgi:hypothetical protein